MRSPLLLLLLVVPGCAESRSLDAGTDAPPTDTSSLGDAPATADVPLDTPPTFDAGERVDVIVVGDVAALAGRSVWMRLRDTSISAVTPWHDVTVPASGAFEERFVDGLPTDVFGVFLEVFVDDGDGVCTTDPAYQVFVSNDFAGRPVRVDFTASPDTAVTCAGLGL